MRPSALLLFSAAALIAGCGSDPTPFTTEDVPRTDAGLPSLDALADRAMADRSTPEVLDLTDATVTPDATADAPCVATIPGEVRFGLDGGLVAFTDTFTLRAPAVFAASRSSGGAVSAMCETTLPGCNTAEQVDVGEVTAALAARDVTAAFGFARGMPSREVLYGGDPRPMDGQVFSIEIDGARVLVGTTCRDGGGTGCMAIPTGVQRLVDVLTALRDQELFRTACMAFRPR